MSDIIQLLPDSVANQIAAGEVIQRPASVIKELVENALDAGATSIHVLVTDAGRTCLQVIDNGCGMSPTDARLSFERHATSKIREASDLFDLHPMGFRGEALASIAAVAQVELRTRTENDELGTLLTINGSRFGGQEPVSCPVGSNFKVENLFYNVPARRKFLKSNTTELNNILSAFERIVLVNPDVSFTLHSNGAELMNLPATGLRQRIVDVFGKKINQELLPVSVDTTLCRINGFVGKPEAAKKKGAYQFFFVNNRYMRHPYFSKAVMTPYERLVPQGEQVPYFIYFDVNPSDIDVNIHPTKTEIKFENEQAIWQILSAAVKEAIGKFNEVPSIDFDTYGKPDIPVYNPFDNSKPAPGVKTNPQYNPFNTPQKTKNNISQWQQLYDGIETEKTTHTSPSLFTQQEGMTPDAQQTLAGGIGEEKSPNHYQYKDRYIVTAVKSGLMIIDQHRAHLRVLYEEYLEKMQQHRWETQKVLFPELLQFSQAEAVAMENILDELSSMGFSVTPLGGGSFSVNGIPAGIEGVDTGTLLRNMVQTAVQMTESAKNEVNASLALTMARNTAIRAGQTLSNVEMENLVNRLFACSNVNLTPDGKNILTIIKQTEIEQMLG